MGDARTTRAESFAIRSAPPVSSAANVWRTIPRTNNERIHRSLPVAGCARDHREALAGGDPPDLLQDGPGVVVRVDLAVVDGLGEILEGGVLADGNVVVNQLLLVFGHLRLVREPPA